MKYSHGDDGYLFTRAIEANFSTNTWYKGPSKALIQHLQEQMPLIGHYPEVYAESLTTTLAEIHQLSPDQILVNNGSTETIFLIAQAFRASNSRIVTPTFSEYEHGCLLFDHAVSFCGYGFITPGLHTPEGLFWLCNPNNPTGQILKREVLAKIIRNNPQTIFVVDEAYSDYCLENESLVPEVSKVKNLIILKSLTKNHCLPGLRLGYMVSHASLKQRIEKFRPPWSTNSLAIQAGHFLCAHPAFEFDELIKYHSLALSFQSELANIDGYEPMPSVTGYFLVKTPFKASELKAKLMHDYGLLIRDASSFRGLTPNHIRVATLDKTKNNLLVSALQNVRELNRTLDFNY